LPDADQPTREGATDDDAELALAAAAGDRRALDSLLRRHTDLVHAVCRRIVVDPDDALDATQEALVAVARGIGRFDGRSKLSTWVYRVATNAALDELRRRGRRPLLAIDTPPEPAVGSGEAAVDARLDVDAALERVPEEFRVAVVLRDLADLEYAEIATVLDVPVGTVKSRVSRGRAALRAELGNPAGVSWRPSESP
jgi:RNA polymerase sigma-70 factor (ECF subfamily)